MRLGRITFEQRGERELGLFGRWQRLLQMIRAGTEERINCLAAIQMIILQYKL